MMAGNFRCSTLTPLTLDFLTRDPQWKQEQKEIFKKQTNKNKQLFSTILRNECHALGHTSIHLVPRCSLSAFGEGLGVRRGIFLVNLVTVPHSSEHPC